MKSFITFAIGSLLLTSPILAQRIDCSAFSIQQYQGNIGAKLLRGKVYGHHIYQLTDSKTDEFEYVTETYQKIMSNVVNAPSTLTIEYSQQDMADQPQSFTIKSSNFRTQTCKVK